MLNRRIFSSAMLAAPLASSLTPAHAASAVIGQPAPDFSATDTAGKTRKLSAGPAAVCRQH